VHHELGALSTFAQCTSATRHRTSLRCRWSRLAAKGVAPWPYGWNDARGDGSAPSWTGSEPDVVGDMRRPGTARCRAVVSPRGSSAA
jgi:hypothetical protein